MSQLLSVVMPAFNSENYVADAIEGILNQTYPNFELIIINDGSTDNTEKEIFKFRDSRIRYLKNDTNLGNNASRNLGIQQAKGQFVAFADSDDISMHNRFEKQLSYLNKNPKISILGTGLLWFGDIKNHHEKFETNPELLSAKLFFGNIVAQPGVMFRKDDFKTHSLSYDVNRENMGDYHLWYRASLAGLKITHLMECLVMYRISENQIRYRNSEDRENKLRIFFEERLVSVGLNWTTVHLDLVFSFLRKKQPLLKWQYYLIKSKINEIETNEILIKRYSQNILKRVCERQKLRAAKYLYDSDKSLVSTFHLMRSCLHYLKQVI